MRHRAPGLRTVVVATFVLAVVLTTTAISLIAYATVRADARSFGRTSELGNYAHIIDLAEINAQVKVPLAERVRARPADATPERLTDYVQRTLGLTFASVVDPARPPLRCTYAPCWTDFPHDVQAAARDGRTFIGGAVPPSQASTYWVAVTPLDTQPRLVLASAARRLGADTEYRVLWQRTALALAAGLVLALLVGLAVAASVRRPLRRIAVATERFGGGDLSVRAPEAGSVELRRLGATFNAMADRLRTTLQELHAARDLQRHFVADVSHELRTPLSTMLATVDGLEAPVPADRQRSAVLLAEQTRRLAGMVEDLLEISRFDAGQAELRTEPVDLAALAADAARSVAAGTAVTVAGDAVCEVDPRRLHTVVRNLLANALRHGVPPVRVLVVQEAGGAATLTVEDQGPGIAPELRSSLFDRFAQGSPARGGGTGLGLAIVLENVRLHGGTLTVSDTAPTRFTVHLPARD